METPNVIIGLVIILVGALIRFFKMVDIIAGYDPDKVADKDGLARWVGTNVMIMGVLWAFMGFLKPALKYPVIGIMAVICLWTAFGCKKYERKG